MKKWQFMPVTPSIVGSIFLIKKVAIYACYPLYSWKHNFDEKSGNLCPLPPLQWEHSVTVWRQKKPPKVNECSSVTNYRTAMIFFLQNRQHSYVFFDGNFFCQEFVCLPFFCPFSPLEGPKRAKKHPQVDKIAILGMKRYSSTSQTL